MPTCTTPPPPCFLAVVKHAYTAQVCAERVCVLSMNRPADKGNDDMEVFILNVIFIDESYELSRLVGSCWVFFVLFFKKGVGGACLFYVVFFLLNMMQ